MFQIIIADDEAMECKVLEKMIIENFSSVQVLPSASNGIELLNRIEQTVPDIAVIDITMPGLNGLDAIEIILKKHPQVKILVVSAYSRFEYAQKALSLGASDYLLKPVKETVFLAAVQKLCSEINSEKLQAQKLQKSDELLKNYQDAVENEFLSEIILEDVSQKVFHNYLHILSHPFHGVFVLSVQISNSLEANAERVYLSILEDMKKICTCVGRIKKQGLILCILPSFSASSEIQRNKIIDDLKCALKNQKGSSFFVGISVREDTIEKLSHGIQESRLALLELSAPGIGCWEDSTVFSNQPPFSYEHDKEVCLTMLKNKRYPSFLDTLMQSSLQLEQLSKPLQYIQIYMLDRIQLLFKLTREDTANRPRSLFYIWIGWEKILASSNYSHLCQNARWIIENYLNHMYDEHSWNRHIINCLTFLSQHYMEDLSLESVSEKNGISSFYLSRLFKQELDYTFLELLTNLRISKAIEFLFEGTYSVQEISEACGYLNTSYFYKLFKKQTGMTIGEMRKIIAIIH